MRFSIPVFVVKVDVDEFLCVDAPLRSGDSTRDNSITPQSRTAAKSDRRITETAIWSPPSRSGSSSPSTESLLKDQSLLKLLPPRTLPPLLPRHPRRTNTTRTTTARNERFMDNLRSRILDSVPIAVRMLLATTQGQSSSLSVFANSELTIGDRYWLARHPGYITRPVDGHTECQGVLDAYYATQRLAKRSRHPKIIRRAVPVYTMLVSSLSRVIATDSSSLIASLPITFCAFRSLFARG